MSTIHVGRRIPTEKPCQTCEGVYLRDPSEQKWCRDCGRMLPYLNTGDRLVIYDIVDEAEA